jgi:hypothetical protein
VGNIATTPEKPRAAPTGASSPSNARVAGGPNPKGRSARRSDSSRQTEGSMGRGSVAVRAAGALEIKKPGPPRGGRAQPGRTTLARDSRSRPCRAWSQLIGGSVSPSFLRSRPRSRRCQEEQHPSCHWQMDPGAGAGRSS